MKEGYYHTANCLDAVNALRGEGKSYLQIATTLGITKGVVAGIMRRKTVEPARRKEGLSVSKPRPKKSKPVAAPAIGPIGNFPAKDCCTFIAGDPCPAFQCCGHPGYPFCDYHRKVCYQPARAQ